MPSIGQDFKQVYFDPNDQENFAICLSKYINGPSNATEILGDFWSPRYWCLIGKFSQVKILKAATIDEIAGDLKWQWSYNINDQLINKASKGRYMNVNMFNGRVKLSPPKMLPVSHFGDHLKIRNFDDCSHNPCLNDGECIDKIGGFTLGCSKK